MRGSAFQILIRAGDVVSCDDVVGILRLLRPDLEIAGIALIDGKRFVLVRWQIIIARGVRYRFLEIQAILQIAVVALGFCVDVDLISRILCHSIPGLDVKGQAGGVADIQDQPLRAEVGQRGPAVEPAGAPGHVIAPAGIGRKQIGQGGGAETVSAVGLQNDPEGIGFPGGYGGASAAVHRLPLRGAVDAVRCVLREGDLRRRARLSDRGRLEGQTQVLDDLKVLHGSRHGVGLVFVAPGICNLTVISGAVEIEFHVKLIACLYGSLNGSEAGASYVPVPLVLRLDTPGLAGEGDGFSLREGPAGGLGGELRTGVGGGDPGVDRLAALGVHPAEHMGPRLGVGNAIDIARIHIQVQGT